MSEYLYSLPFDSNKHRLNITQGRHGPWSHLAFNNTDLENAVDFGVPLGTEVLASRSGEVLSVIDWSTTYYDGSDQKTGLSLPAFSANFVVVEHGDDTAAIYSHFEAQGAFVRHGDKVEAGQSIGRTGLSGWVGVPHVHFHVYSQKSWISLPVRFREYNGPLLHRELTGRI